MNFFNGKSAPKALVAPLDWGLGHATRCIPIVRALLDRGWQVWLAGEPPVQSLLQAEFPNLPWLPLDGYRVHYGSSALTTAIRMILQVPRLLAAIGAERRWLERQMAEHQFDLVISDNRYGLHHPGARCVFLGHQLQIQTLWGIARQFIRRLQYRFINRFDACWIPDFPGGHSLSGQLAHPEVLPAVPVRYTGPLSRLQPPLGAPVQPYILLLVSGPEPQRSMLEAILLQQAGTLPFSFVLVRGLPGQHQLPAVASNITVYNHLPAGALQQQMAAASLVVCRSGYSTIMDLSAMGKKSILIPTPGQTEQQYLASHLQESGWAVAYRQRGFRLQKALSEAQDFAYRSWPEAATHLLAQAMDLDCGLALQGKAFTENNIYH